MKITEANGRGEARGQSDFPAVSGIFAVPRPAHIRLLIFRIGILCKDRWLLYSIIVTTTRIQ